GEGADLREHAEYRLGACALRAGRHAEAAEAMGRLLEEFPKSAFAPSALLIAGESLLKTGRAEAAAADFKRVVEEFGSDAACGPALLRLGECCGGLQRWEESGGAFAEYLKRFSESELWFQARFGMGWSLENRGKHDEAIEE